MLRLGAVFGVLLVLLLGGADTSSAEPQAIARFREIETAHSALGRFAGATETWRTAILLSRANKRAGTGYVSCVRITRWSAMRECTGTYALPRGLIQVAGLVLHRSRFELLVTGGTGVYAGRGGSALFVQLAGDPRQSSITFYLT